MRYQSVADISLIYQADTVVVCRRTGLGDLAFPERLCQEVHLHAIGLFNDLNAVSHKLSEACCTCCLTTSLRKRRSS